jgi:dipeptidyl aminopeptidase/acylaminoacyl peptidase
MAATDTPDEAYPLPEKTEPIPVTVFPTEIIIHVGPGDGDPIPTLTPWPSNTPYPTSTTRPGAAATAMPLLQPAGSPAGTIWYTSWYTSLTQTSSVIYTYTNHALQVDADGQTMAAPELSILLAELDTQFTSRIYAIYPSPGGQYLALAFPSEPGVVISILSRATGVISTPLADFAPGQFLGWHPDGRQFLFFVDGGGPWLVDADTSELTLRTFHHSVQGGAISPDGLSIAYIVKEASQNSLWLVSSSGGDDRSIIDTGPLYMYPTAWSPDGTRLAYYGNCPGLAGSGPLCLFDFVTGEHQALNIPSFFSGSIPWSPDGRYIAATGFVEHQCEESGLSELEKDACQFDDRRVIYLEDVATGEVRPLASGYAPVWSPDGSRLAFLSNRSGAIEIWVIHVDGSNLQQLTVEDGTISRYFIWSRDMEK